MKTSERQASTISDDFACCLINSAYVEQSRERKRKIERVSELLPFLSEGAAWKRRACAVRRRGRAPRRHKQEGARESWTTKTVNKRPTPGSSVRAVCPCSVVESFSCHFLSLDTFLSIGYSQHSRKIST